MSGKSHTVNIGCGPIAALMLIAAGFIAYSNGFGWLVWLILVPIWLPLAILSFLFCAALLIAFFVAIFEG